MLISCSPVAIPQREELPPPPAPEQPAEPNPPASNALKITIGSASFTATLAPNATATAFKVMLPITLTMSDFNSNEKVCSLPNSLPTAAASPGTIHAGDLMLYGSNSIVLFYETFLTSYSYTSIGTVDDPSELREALGSGSITLKFEMQ